MNNDDLDPRVVDAMRSVPPVDPAIRETHIAAAIEQASTSTFTYTANFIR
jgi:hypothetical protein